MSTQFTCIVNSIGPTSGDWEGNFLDPRADPDTYGPTIVITLTSVDNTFNSFSVLASIPTNNTNPPLASALLAVGLAAINSGKYVLADIDWPQPVVGKDQDGNDILGPSFCYSLWLNAT